MSMLTSVLKSRLFAVVVMIWLVVASLMAVASPLGEPQVTYGSVPNYSVILLTGVNGTEVSAYTQIINQTGVGAADAPVSYSLSYFSGQSWDLLSTGNAGVTNASGYLHYDVPGLFQGQIFSLQERASLDGRSYSTTSVIFQMLPNASGNIYFPPISDIVTVTPVVDGADHSLYSLHLWEIPGSGSRNLTVSYAVSPTSYGAFDAVDQGYHAGSKFLANITFANEANVPTPLQIYAKPCFYAVNVSSNGHRYGGSIFGPLYTHAVESAFSVNFIEGVSSTLIIFWPMVLALILASGLPGEEHRFQRRLLNGIKFPSGGRNSWKFLMVTGVAFAASLPLVVISQAVSYGYSMEAYATAPSFAAFLGYFLSMSAICFLAAAIVSLLNTSGIRNSRLFKGKKVTGRGSYWGIFAPVYALCYYFALVNSNGFLWFNSGSRVAGLVVTSDLFYPLSMEWLYGMSLTGNLFFGYPYTFQPSAYGIGLETISLLVSVWVTIVLVIPFLIMRRREDNSSTGQP